jgi:vanillate O-demethylase ferredoxin subunit
MIKAELKNIAREAEDINLLEFRRSDGSALPPFSAGAHIDLRLGNGLVRSYSLVNCPSETHRYVIGVKKEPDSRGGSRFIHEQLHAGDEIEIGQPLNNFRLCENAPRSVLIAGGIGITPFASMVRRLEQLGRSWELHYAARSRCSASFVRQLASYGSKVKFYFPNEFNGEPPARRIDLHKVVAEVPRDAHVYCCGPRNMLATFEKAAAALPSGQTHVEFFSNANGLDKDGAFDVRLARSGSIVRVQSGETVLDALLKHGIDAPYSCLEGVCSSCETRVLSGIPDHRDLILSKEEREANDRMLICCSRSKSGTLVLDL